MRAAAHKRGESAASAAENVFAKQSSKGSSLIPVQKVHVRRTAKMGAFPNCLRQEIAPKGILGRPLIDAVFLAGMIESVKPK
jgi:hypothetical protein